MQLGAALASRPEASLPPQTGSWHDLKAAYRLLQEPDVTHAALSEPHWQNTRRQAAQAGTVLFVQDTSELDFTAHRQTKDLGWIGNTGGRGFFLHSCLAVRPAAVPEILGVAAQRVWTRHEVKKGTETRAARARRPKESEVWAEMVETMGPAAPDQCWVSVSDRASDLFSLVRRARAQGWHCLWRVGQNRLVLTGSGREAKLLDWARRLPAQTGTLIELRGRTDQPRRTVRLQVAWSVVTLRPPRNGPERQQTLVSGWCVRCWETGKGKNALEWILFSAGDGRRDGAGADRVVPVALGGRGISQSSENRMCDGTATTAECAGTAGLIRFSGDCGGATAAVTHHRPYGPGYASKPGGGAGVIANCGPVTRRSRRPDDGGPVLAHRGELRRVPGPQRRWRSWLADPVAWLGTLTGLMLGCASNINTRQ